MTAQAAGLIACTTCGRVVEAPAGAPCPRCDASLESRSHGSLQRVWAWLIAGMIAYIPANTYPIMTTRFLASKTDSTIIGGAVDLITHGAWFVGGIVLLASVVVPMLKFAVIIFLALSIHFGWRVDPHQRLHLYEIIEYIGRWSMIDVFVVAILASLIRFGALATIEPGPAAAAFGLSVVCTMIAAQQFDPRLIWDADDR